MIPAPVFEWVRRIAVTIAMIPLLAVDGSASSAAAFRVEELAAGVWLFRPTANDPRWTNSLVVERSDGLLVVEAQPDPESARELLAAIRSRSDRPVRFLVLSHAHAESGGGASGFPADVVVIGSDRCFAMLADESFDFGAERRLAAQDPALWQAPPRPKLSIAVPGSIELPDPRNPVTLETLRTAHSPGDLLVALPDGLVYMGALLFNDRNPYAADGDIGSWVAALNRIATQRPKRLIGLRGDVSDVLELRRQRDALAWIRAQVEYGFIQALPPETIRRNVLESPDLGRHFNVDAAPSFIEHLVERTVEESLAQRRKRGLD